MLMNLTEPRMPAPGVTLPELNRASRFFPKIDGCPFGEGSIGVCYAAESAVLKPALERLGRFLVAA
jgi:hypothetical protein